VTSDIWLVSVEDGLASQLTLALGEDGDPVWSPDGKRVVFASNRNGTFDIYQKDMSGDVETLYQTRADVYPEDWSQDGRIIVFARRSERGDFDLWSLNVESEHASPIVQTPSDERHARLAPDGRWLAYVSNESGQSEVYVQPFPNLDTKSKVSTGGGYWPSWRGDGKELFYVSEDGNLMAVPIGDSTRASRPEILFPTNWDGASLVAAKPYAVTADGTRFLLTRPASSETDISYTVSDPWTSGLR
jgi:Tol biopolymer transport system component